MKLYQLNVIPSSNSHQYFFNLQRTNLLLGNVAYPPTNIYPSRSQGILGLFSNCKDAIEEATKIYSGADGCFFCCRDCHKR